jgi:hypothetical protein
MRFPRSLDFSLGSTERQRRNRIAFQRAAV